MVWRTGSNEDALWLQFGDFSSDAAEILLSFVRPRQVKKVEIQLRLAHLDGSAAAGAEIPRYAKFRFDWGEASTSYVDGVGFIVDGKGKIYFTTGRGEYDEDLSVYKPIIDLMTDDFGIIVEGTAFNFKIDAANREVLAALFDASEPKGQP